MEKMTSWICYLQIIRHQKINKQQIFHTNPEHQPQGPK
jgi:hypothetical protein